jgi:hypothetical protein
MASIRNLPKAVLENLQTLQSSGIIAEDRGSSEDSAFKAIWDEQIGAKKTAFAYREAHVLLLSWHPDDDDLHVEQEVR